MKKNLCMLCVALFAATLSPAVSEDFDTVLRTGVSELIKDADEPMKTVAVFSIKTDWGTAISDYIQRELEYQFVKKLGAGNVVSRDDFTKSLITSEIEYNQSGAVSNETLQDCGEIIGVDTIVSGDFSDTANGWLLMLKASQTKTGKHIAIWRTKIDAGDKDVQYLVAKGGKSRESIVRDVKQVTVEHIESETDLLAYGYQRFTFSRGAEDNIIIQNPDKKAYEIAVYAVDKKGRLDYYGTVHTTEKRYKDNPLNEDLDEYRAIWLKVLGNKQVCIYDLGEKHSDQYFEIR